MRKMLSSLKFTVEKESDHQPAFLDVFVHKISTAFLTSVYRKPTFFWAVYEMGFLLPSAAQNQFN